MVCFSRYRFCGLFGLRPPDDAADERTFHRCLPPLETEFDVGVLPGLWFSGEVQEVGRFACGQVLVVHLFGDVVGKHVPDAGVRFHRIIPDEIELLDLSLKGKIQHVGCFVQEIAGLRQLEHLFLGNGFPAFFQVEYQQVGVYIFVGIFYGEVIFAVCLQEWTADVQALPHGVGCCRDAAVGYVYIKQRGYVGSREHIAVGENHFFVVFQDVGDCDAVVGLQGLIGTSARGHVSFSCVFYSALRPVSQGNVRQVDFHVVEQVLGVVETDGDIGTVLRQLLEDMLVLLGHFMRQEDDVVILVCGRMVNDGLEEYAGVGGVSVAAGNDQGDVVGGESGMQFLVFYFFGVLEKQDLLL